MKEGIPKLISHLKSRTTTSSSSSSSPLPACYNLYNATTSLIRNQIQPASKSEIQQCIHDGYEAQQQWHHDYTPTQKAQIFLQASKLLSDPHHRQHLTTLEVNDTSRPIQEIQSYDVPTAIETLSYYAYMPSILPSGSTMTQLDPNHSFGYTIREPLGLTLGIGAWNYPLVNAVMKSAPCLIFGNAMVYKPSEMTPSSALFLAEVYEEAGLPQGVFQVLLGEGKDVGNMLVEEYCGWNQNGGIEGKISFTGSVTTGRQIAAMTTCNNNTTSSCRFHRLNLELGGKSPLIIMDDYDDIDHAVQTAMNANWYSNGQVCSNGTRVFIHESMYDTFVSKLIHATSQLNIGDPNCSHVDIGPMISKEHMDRVLKYVDIGTKEDGATLLYGGERLYNNNEKEDNEFQNGYFLSPAIFTNCTDDMRIVQEEVFGMLMTIMTFQDETEVIQRANGTNFGLAAGILTKDIKCAHRMASKLKAGTVWVNNYNTSHLSMPWGAVKQSGIGRENGTAALEAWTTEKVVFVDME